MEILLHVQNQWKASDVGKEVERPSAVYFQEYII